VIWQKDLFPLMVALINPTVHPLPEVSRSSACGVSHLEQLFVGKGTG